MGVWWERRRARLAVATGRHTQDTPSRLARVCVRRRVRVGARARPLTAVHDVDGRRMREGERT